MSRANVVVLDKDWWKNVREPSKALVIAAKPPRRLFDEDRAYRVKECAARLSVSIHAIYDYIRDGLEAQPLKKEYRILGTAMNDYLFELWKKRQAG